MAIKMSVAVRNARLDAIETAIGTAAILKIRNGTVPTNIGDADSGTVLATLSLPSDWMATAASGQKTLTGSWTDTSADATGTAGHFRIYATDGTTQHIQGTITATGGGGDMTLNNTSITSGGTVTVTSFTLTDGNA